MRKTANQIAWEVLIKIAVVDPVIAEHVKRVAKRMNYQTPSKKDLDAMFPKGWEKKSPSWQTQFEKSPWLKAQNAAKASGTAGARAKSYRGRGRNVWADVAASGRGYSYGRGWKSWAPRAAAGMTRNYAPLILASTIPGVVHSIASQDIMAMQRKGKHITAEEKQHILDPIQSRTLRGMGLGTLGGATIPFIARIPGMQQHGVGRFLRRHGGSLIPSAMMMGITGMVLGTGLGSLSGLPEAKKRMRTMQKKIKERKKAAGLLA